MNKAESFPVAFFLTLSGGFFDAYSYACRGGVFANAETGNMVLFGIELANRNFKAALFLFFPILSYFFGVILTEFIKKTVEIRNKDKFQRIVLLVEILSLISVAFIPKKLDVLATSLLSFICAMQVDAFRKMNGNPFASTMCTGNLRTMSDYFFNSISKKDISLFKKSLIYLLIISIFILGAILGFFLTKILGIKSILLGTIPIIFAFFLI